MNLLDDTSWITLGACIHPVFGPAMGTLNFVDYWTSTSWSPSPQNNA